MILPTEVEKIPPYDKVTKLLIGGLPGTGKTHLCSTLPNSLLIDLESGHRPHFGGLCIDVKDVATTESKTLAQGFREVITLIKAANVEEYEKNKRKKYDFITWDNITQLQEIVKVKAAADYNASHMGKSQIKNGSAPIIDVTTELGQVGWMYYLTAYKTIFDMCTDLANECTIFLAHTTQSSLAKKQEQIVINDLQITGKAKLWTLLNVDDAGVLTIENNKGILDFKQDPKSPTKTRARHLNSAEIEISEYDPKTAKLTTHWDKIFPYYFENGTSK